jgi:hypothetical protein
MNGHNKESYPLPGIDSYVAALKNRLYIPEKKHQELEFTNKVRLKEWMPEIKLMEDDRPPLKAKIGSKGIFLTSDMKLPNEIDEDTPVAQVVQADALYLAKLKYLREMAPQTTSWGRGKTKEREIEKQIAELTSSSVGFGGNLDRVSFKEVFKLNPRKLPLALVTASFALGACTGKIEPTEPVGAETTMTEVAPVPSEEVKTATPSKTPTKESSPTATPSVFIEHGPKVKSKEEYPSVLKQTEVSSRLNQESQIPEGFQNDFESKSIIQDANDLFEGGKTEDETGKPTIVSWGEGKDFWWDIVIENEEGGVTSWLMIADDSTETGWRYAEGPMWDSDFNPGKDEFKFGKLPEKFHPDNHYELILYEGHRIPVEIDHIGEVPIRWLNVENQKMELLEGVPFPSLTPEQEEVAIDYFTQGLRMAAEDCMRTPYTIQALKYDEKMQEELNAYLRALYERVGLSSSSRDPEILVVTQEARGTGCWVGAAGKADQMDSGTMFYENAGGELITVPVNGLSSVFGELYK